MWWRKLTEVLKHKFEEKKGNTIKKLCLHGFKEFSFLLLEVKLLFSSVLFRIEPVDSQTDVKLSIKINTLLYSYVNNQYPKFVTLLLIPFGLRREISINGWTSLSRSKMVTV